MTTINDYKYDKLGEAGYSGSLGDRLAAMYKDQLGVTEGARNDLEMAWLKSRLGISSGFYALPDLWAMEYADNGYDNAYDYWANFSLGFDPAAYGLLVRDHNAESEAGTPGSTIITSWGNDHPDLGAPSYDSIISGVRLEETNGARWLNSGVGLSGFRVLKTASHHDVVDTHLFAVFQISGASGDQPIAAGAYGTDIQFGIDGAGNLRMWGQAPSPAVWGNTLSGAWAHTPFQWYLGEAILRASGTSQLLIDGSIIASTTTGQGSSVTLDHVFGGYQNTAGNIFAGGIHRFLVYSLVGGDVSATPVRNALGAVRDTLNGI